MNKKNLFIAVFLVSVTVLASVFMKWEDLTKTEKGIYFSEQANLKELAKRNNIPLKEILHHLSHEDYKYWQLPRNKPLEQLAIDPVLVKHAIEHESEGSPVFDIAKFILWAVLLSIVVLYVLKNKSIGKFRLIAMPLSVLVFGVILADSPNPMEATVKLFKLFNKMAGEPIIVITSFILFTLFSIWGAKLICSWGCHLGTLQESLFNIPVFKKKYKFQVPFAISLVIRLAFFIVFIMLLFGIGLDIKNFVIYHQVNYFKLFRPANMAPFALYSLPVLVVASFFVFRPFCQFLCPFGLWAWLLQNIAINKIRIERDKCIDCKKCEKACPTEAMKGIYENKRKLFLPDCWSCGKCIDACPTNAIQYSVSEKNQLRLENV
jgi:NAD-dependent dihydropyrimidine dehydrogenase PreA subunit